MLAKCECSRTAKKESDGIVSKTLSESDEVFISEERSSRKNTSGKEIRTDMEELPDGNKRISSTEMSGREKMLSSGERLSSTEISGNKNVDNEENSAGRKGQRKEPAERHINDSNRDPHSISGKSEHFRAKSQAEFKTIPESIGKTITESKPVDDTKSKPVNKNRRTKDNKTKEKTISVKKTKPPVPTTELSGGMYPLFLLPKGVSEIIKEHGNNFRTMEIRRTGRHNFKIEFTVALKADTEKSRIRERTELTEKTAVKTKMPDADEENSSDGMAITDYSEIITTPGNNQTSDTINNKTDSSTINAVAEKTVYLSRKF